MANSFFLNHTALYYYFFYSCIYFFLAMLGLPCCVGFSLIAVHGFFWQWLLFLRSIGSGTRGLSHCGKHTELPHDTWNLPRSGIKPVSPALADRFFTTEPPGKPLNVEF